MRIVVILGRVLDPSGITVNRRRGRIFVNRKEYMLQPADRCAIEAALRIKDAVRPERSPGAEVVALPRGPLPDDDVLRQALALGVDKAVYLTGNGLKKAGDAVMTRVLAAAVERLGGADLVLTGAVTMDTGQSQLGSRLAEALGCSQILNAWQVQAGNGKVQAVIQSTSPPVGGDRGGGCVTVEADLPAVVTMLPGSLKLRYPDGARLVNVYKGVGEIAEALEQWDVADLSTGLKAGLSTRLKAGLSTGLKAGLSTELEAGLADADTLEPLLEQRGQDFPPERERGTRLSGLPAEMAQAAADALKVRTLSVRTLSVRALRQRMGR